MRTTPEGEVKKEIDKLLNRYRPHVWYHKAVVTGMGKPTVDYTGCCLSKYFAIEAKAPGKEPTKRQAQTLHEMEEAGARTFVIDNADSDEFKALRIWLQIRVDKFGWKDDVS